MKRLMLAGLVLAGSFAAIDFTAPQATAADKIDCALVRCFPCDEGWVHAPKGDNCCRCVPA